MFKASEHRMETNPAYETVVCVACSGVHLVNAGTDKVMGDDDRGFRPRLIAHQSIALIDALN